MLTVMQVPPPCLLRCNTVEEVTLHLEGTIKKDAADRP